MLKFCVPLQLLIVFSLTTVAQTPFSKIPTRKIVIYDNKLDLQGFAVNDSILLISAPEHENANPKVIWVLPSGLYVPVNAQPFKNKLIIGVANTSDSTYFYYLEDHKSSVSLGAIIQSRTSGSIQIAHKKISIVGEFIGLSQEKGIRVISNEKNEIHIQEIFKLDSLEHKSFSCPLNLIQYKTPKVFISKNTPATSSQIASPFKIYLNNDVLTLVLDESSPKEELPAKTTFVKIDLTTRQSLVHEVFDTSGKQFSTFIDGNFIYKLNKSREEGFVINIYKLIDFELIKSFSIDKLSPMSKNKAVKRSALDAFDKESVWDAMSNNNKGFIIAQSTDSANMLLKVGSHHTLIRRSGPYIPIISAIPILGIIGGLTRLALMKASDPESVDQYFYLNWNKEGAIEFCKNTVSIDQLIDTYDIDMFKNKIRFSYKGFIRTKNLTYGLYLKREATDLDIISFKNP